MTHTFKQESRMLNTLKKNTKFRNEIKNSRVNWRRKGKAGWHVSQFLLRSCFHASLAQIQEGLESSNAIEHYYSDPLCTIPMQSSEVAHPLICLVQRLYLHLCPAAPNSLSHPLLVHRLEDVQLQPSGMLFVMRALLWPMGATERVSNYSVLLPRASVLAMSNQLLSCDASTHSNLPALVHISACPNRRQMWYSQHSKLGPLAKRENSVRDLGGNC